jgi:hypothetical protein
MLSTISQNLESTSYKAFEDIKDANARHNQLITECDHKLIPLTPNQIRSLKDHEDLDSWD